MLFLVVSFWEMEMTSTFAHGQFYFLHSFTFDFISSSFPTVLGRGRERKRGERLGKGA